MCRACLGNYPTAAEYQKLGGEAAIVWQKWVGNRSIARDPGFIQDVVALDNFRLNTGAGWGNPGHMGWPQKRVFENPDPTKGLLLYLLGNFLDAQTPTERVWSQYLKEADEWLSGVRQEPPRANYRNVGPHLCQLRATAERSGSMVGWFANTIAGTVAIWPTGKGNLYRFTGRFFQDMLKPAQRRRNTNNSNC